MDVRLNATHRRMRWKNGKGETVEIAVSPEGADIDAFDWRISTAAVVEDGPFSCFLGIDRTLAVLSGGELLLSIDAAPPQRVTSQSAPLRFAADAPCHARLIGEPVTDLNVMSRRGRWRHALLRLTAVPQVQTAREAFVVAAPGSACLTVDETTVHLSALDAVRLTHGQTLTLRSGDAWLIQFDPVSE